MSRLADEKAANPLRQGLRQRRRAGPCILVIFGASGDLAQRKLLPALYSLAHDETLDDLTQVIAVARSDYERDAFLARVREGIEQHARAALDEALWQRVQRGIEYFRMDYDDEARYAALAERLARIESGWRHLSDEPVTRVFYLAIPPSAFEGVVARIGASGLAGQASEGLARLIIEKPFGHDIASAQQLNAALNSVFPERSVFRIDHYLGKETVQNLLVFRFANGMFEPLWNARHVDHVQITVSEAIGVEGRGAYYEESGAIRDMVQNHVFQLLALTAMEPPVAFEADAVRDEKVKVLRALRPIDPSAVGAHCARGQYTRGAPGGREIGGYLDEPQVAPDSTVETYVALKVFVDNWRWGGTPFYLRTGKGLPKKATEISIHFRPPPHRLFADNRAESRGTPLAENVLAIRIQPDEGMSLRFQSKVPGPQMVPHPVTMEFRYASSFGAAPAGAYERLVLDALVGDGTLFTRDDEVEASWAWISRLIDAWEGSAVEQPEPYAAGSWGPPSADALLAVDQRRWRRS